MTRTALVTGITGQDGSYLSKLLLEKGYTVYGLMPRSTRYAFTNLDYLQVTGDVDFIDGDLADEASLIHAVHRTRPDEVYNLAAQSFVGTSWDQPMWTTDVNACGTLRLLEAVRSFAPERAFTKHRRPRCSAIAMRTAFRRRGRQCILAAPTRSANSMPTGL